MTWTKPKEEAAADGKHLDVVVLEHDVADDAGELLGVADVISGEDDSEVGVYAEGPGGKALGDERENRLRKNAGSLSFSTPMAGRSSKTAKRP